MEHKERKDLILLLVSMLVGVYLLFKLKDFVGDVGKGLGDFFGGAVGGVSKTIGDFVGGIVEGVGNLAGGAVKAVGDVVSVPVEFVSNIMNAVGKGLGDLVGGVTKTIEDVVSVPVKAMTDAVNNVNQALQNLAGFLGGSVDVTKNVASEVAKVVSDIFTTGAQYSYEATSALSGYSNYDSNYTGNGQSENVVENVVNNVAKVVSDIFTTGAQYSYEATSALSGYSGYTDSGYSENTKELTQGYGVRKDVITEAGKQLEEGKIDILDFIRVIQGQKDLTSTTTNEVDYSSASVCPVVDTTGYGVCLAEGTGSSDAYIPAYKSSFVEQPSRTQVIGAYGEVYDVIDVYGKPLEYVETEENRAQWEAVPLPWRWWEM